MFLIQCEILELFKWNIYLEINIFFTDVFLYVYKLGIDTNPRVCIQGVSNVTAFFPKDNGRDENKQQSMV